MLRSLLAEASRFDVTPTTIGMVLGLYVVLGLFFVVMGWRGSAVERKTFVVIGLVWALGTFVGNYLLHLAGVMSFMPWVTNFMHTFLWIGICLSMLYLGVREDVPFLVQCLLFALFSFIVKQVELALFGTWDHDHFFWIFEGNFAYILGWSLADGLYPPLTLYGLRLLGKRIPGLVVL